MFHWVGLMVKNLKIGWLLVWLLVGFNPLVYGQVVNIYSYRQAFLVEPILKTFTQETGIQVQILYAGSGLAARLRNEGPLSPADLILTTDIGQTLQIEGLTQAVSNQILEKAVPAKYQHSKNHWFGLTTRSRIIYYAKGRVSPNAIETYEQLADPKWRGKICIRSGKHAYNLSLIASMILTHGEEKAADWLRGLKANLARRPQGNDRAQVKALKEGVCDLAIGNSYYYGKMVHNEKEPEQKEWAAAAGLIFPNQKDRGTHVGLTSVALTSHAPNRDSAIKLMEFLVGEQAQSLYAKVNYESPVRQATALSDFAQKTFGTFKADSLSLEEIGKYRQQASELVDKVGFDQ